jgi:hypothetical protein
MLFPNNESIIYHKTEVLATGKTSGNKRGKINSMPDFTWVSLPKQTLTKEVSAIILPV